MLDVFCCSDLSEPSGSSAGDELVDEIDDDEDDEDVIDLVDEAQPETTGQSAQCLPSESHVDYAMQSLDAGSMCLPTHALSETITAALNSIMLFDAACKESVVLGYSFYCAWWVLVTGAAFTWSLPEDCITYVNSSVQTH